MEAVITVDVRTYRLVIPNGSSNFVLQVPVTSREQVGDGVLLFRQDQGAKNNQTTLKRRPTNLEEVHLQKSTLAHGILIRTSQACDYKQGDQVWLAEEASKFQEPRQNASVIGVFSLRSWKRLTVPLKDVCWIPKYRKLDRGDGEELLTISGPPVRRPNKKSYVLAVVQRLDNQAANTGTDVRVEIRELVEQELFQYDNLSQKQGGIKDIVRLVQRRMLDMASNPTARATLTFREHASDILEPISRQRAAVTLAAPPLEQGDLVGDEDSDLEVGRAEQVIMAKAMALISPRRAIPPQQLCNLAPHQCPTPPHTISLNLFRSAARTHPIHHHLLDYDCPIGPKHETHCVYASPHVPRCIITSTSGLRHMCCVQSVYPWNKRIYPPTAVMTPPVQGGMLVKGGRAATMVHGAEEFADLPVEVEPLEFDAVRDGDARFWSIYGLDDREDVRHGGWVPGGESLSGTMGEVLPGVMGAPLVAGELDVSRDRRYY